MNDRGTADLLLLAAILAGTLIGVQVAASAWNVLDDGALRMAAYSAAIIAGWKFYRAASVIFGLDNRLERVEKRQIRIEKHLGLEPLPEDTGA